MSQKSPQYSSQQILQQRLNQFLVRRYQENQKNQLITSQEENNESPEPNTDEIPQYLQKEQEVMVQFQKELEEKIKSSQLMLAQHQKDTEYIYQSREEEQQQRSQNEILEREQQQQISKMNQRQELNYNKQYSLKEHESNPYHTFGKEQFENNYSESKEESKENKISTEESTNELNRSKSNKQGKIEDRLINQGTKMKQEKEQKIKQYEQQLKKEAVPKINKKQISHNSSQQNLENNSENKSIQIENVADRLFSYHQFYREKQQQNIQNVEKETTPSFTPKINRGPKPKEIERIEKLQNPKHIEQNKEYSFKPKIDKISEKLAQKQGNLEQRLFKRKVSTPNIEVNQNVPIINDKSRKIVTREGSVFNNLYNQDKEKKEKLEQTKSKYEMKEKEQLNKECTFTPNFCKNPKYVNSVKEDINERTKIWQQTKAEKLKQIAQLQADKEITGCTFQPQFESKQQQIQINKEIQQLQNRQNIEKTYEKFILRQQEGRKLREETKLKKELRVNPSPKENNPISYQCKTPLNVNFYLVK